MELTLREIPDFLPPWSYACLGAERRDLARRTAARRAFVQLKLGFTRAAALVGGPTGAALQRQICHASEPLELWMLQGRLLAALPEESAQQQARDLSGLLAQALARPAQTAPR